MISAAILSTVLSGISLQSAQPYLVEGGRAGTWRKYQLAVFQEYDVLSRMPRANAEWYQRKFGYDLGHPAGFVPSGGKIYYLSKTGGTSGLTYSAASNARVFERYIAAEIASRGATATATGPDLEKRISSDPEQREVPVTGGPQGATKATVTVNKPDLHVKYAANAIWLSFDPESLRLPLRRLSRFAKLTSKYDWYLSYRPGAIPKNQRVATLKQVEKVTSVSFQQRDDEDLSDYSVRRTIGEEYLDLYRRSLFDIDEVTSWIRHPTDSKPCRVQFRLKALPKTPLARLIGELPGKRRMSMKELNSSRASLFVNLSIPSKIRSSLEKLLLTTNLSDTPLAIQDQLKRGHLVFGAHVIDNESGEQAVSGGAQLRLPEEDLQTIQSVLPGKVQGNRFTTDISLASVKGLDFGEQTLVIRPNGKETRFAFGSLDEQLTNALDEPILRQSNQRGSIIQIQGDLSPWIFQEDTSSAHRLLANLFFVYQKIRYERARDRFMEQIRQRGGRTKVSFPALSPLPALRDIAWKNGDWSFRLKIKVTGETLIADAEIGKELFDYVLLRHRVTR